MAGITQLFVASTLYGVMNLAAAIDSDQFGGQDRDQRTDRGRRRIRRVLLVSNNAALPEITPAATELPGFELLAKRFDRVVSYNDLIEPFHPSAWSPRPIDTPILQRHLRASWGLGEDDIHLVVESLQVNPAQAICRLFPDARIDVYADGLMSYGPTRNPIGALIGTRLERLLYAELVPGLRPNLLTEWDVTPVVIPTLAIRRVIAELPDPVSPPADGADGADGADERPFAVLLGQYLSALGILDEPAEEELHRQMLIGAVRQGYRRLIFKPHPNAPRALAGSLRAEAERRGVDLQVSDDASLVETWYGRLPISAVIGCFSTALLTASTFYRIPTYRVGTELVLERLSPYHNSNRIPVTIVDAAVADLSATDDRWEPATELLPGLVAAVSYVMQPQRQPERRPEAEEFLRTHYPTHVRYFRRRRLAALDLPGAPTPHGPAGWAVVRARARHLAGLARQLAGFVGVSGLAGISGSLRRRTSAVAHRRLQRRTTPGSPDRR